MYVCVSLNNSGTAGPIWLNFFLLAPSWSRDGFRLKKVQIRDQFFSKNPSFSGFPRKPDLDFFGLKPPRDQDGANKKKFIQIGPAIPEL